MSTGGRQRAKARNFGQPHPYQTLAEYAEYDAKMSLATVRAMIESVARDELFHSLRPLAHRIAYLLVLGRQMLGCDDADAFEPCHKCGVCRCGATSQAGCGNHGYTPACAGPETHVLPSRLALQRLCWLATLPTHFGEPCDVDSLWCPDVDALDAWQPDEEMRRRVFLAVSDAVRAVDLDDGLDWRGSKDMGLK